MIDEVRSAPSGPPTDWTQFFARPVEIDRFDWNVGSALNRTLDPWTEWLSNSRVSNRLSNYRSFRGTLKVKYILNGNNFYWGRALASYLPRPYQTNYNLTDNSIINLMPMSQRMHLYIDPTTSQGGEFTLPFFYEYDSLDLTSYDAAKDSLGQINLKSFTPLRHASATDPVHFSIYAWCEDIQLSGPTSVNVSGILPQAGMLDEYSKKPISTVANVIADTAGKLASLPGVGPWALASQMAAKGIGDMASLMGYSRPREISNNERRRINNIGELSSFDTPDTSQSLALAVKNEVTVDPRVAGLSDEDEMSLNFLNSKESFFALVNWNKNDFNDKVLFSCPVMPGMYRVDNYTIPASLPATVMTPMCALQRMFQYWRGTIRYRVQIVASGYHKGRIICYHDAKLGNIPGETNIVQTRIVDIAEERDFYIDIPFMHPHGGLPTLVPSEVEPFSSTTTSGVFNDYANGVFTIAVSNNLVASSPSTDPVHLLISMCAPEMEYWNPIQSIQNLTYVFQPLGPPTETKVKGSVESSVSTLRKESGPMISDENKEVSNASPEGEEALQSMSGSQPIGDKVALIFSGERIHSMRQIIKRYGYNFSKNITIPPQDPGDIYAYTEVIRSLPIMRGSSYPEVLSVPGEVATTPLAYVIPWYAGYRGSLRGKIVFAANGDSIDSVYMARNATTEGSLVSLVSTSATADADGDVSNVLKDTIGGNANIIANTREGSNIIEWTNPWYQRKRFSLIDQTTSGVIPTNFSQSTAMQFLTFPMAKNNSLPPTPFSEDSRTIIYHRFVAAGDDFSLLYFNGIPPVWVI